jgi:hypothetical protein
MYRLEGPGRPVEGIEHMFVNLPRRPDAPKPEANRLDR